MPPSIANKFPGGKKWQVPTLSINFLIVRGREEVPKDMLCTLPAFLFTLGSVIALVKFA
jgi:hypothetical protein